MCSERQPNEMFIKHGHASNGTRTPEYRCWSNIIDRCTNPDFKNWAGYGGRGISVCDRWRGTNGFTSFLQDMGTRPSGHSIDRIDNNGNYEPGNCRWATRSQQQSNRRPVSEQGRINIGKAHLGLKHSEKSKRLMSVKSKRRILNESDVLLIRSLHKSGQFSYAAMGRRFGVTKQAIWLLVRGRNWRHALNG